MRNNYYDGIYYFEDKVYSRYMTLMSEQIKIKYNKNCSFIIFSSDDTSLEEECNIYRSRYPWYVDHYLMSKCDYLLGPPSTFTMWASYIGNVKYLHFGNDSGEIDLNTFEVCKNPR